MSVREFVDTNILIYAFDLTAGEKRDVAATLVARLWSERAGCVSFQVLQELYVTTTKKLGMAPKDAAAQIHHLGRWTLHRPRLDDILQAIDLHRTKKISFWDAMIVRSAMSLDCSVLWSEDLSDGQQFEGVTIRNPFGSSKVKRPHERGGRLG